MWFIKEVFIFLFGFFFPFLVLGFGGWWFWAAVVVFWVFFVPRYAKACNRLKAIIDRDRQKTQVKRALLKGKADAQLLDETVAELRQRGEL